jgi:uncharacterized protein (TIGR02145 family)
MKKFVSPWSRHPGREASGRTALSNLLLSAHGHQGGIHTFYTGACLIAFLTIFLVACGDDDSDFASRPDGKESSISAGSSSSERSSSSVTLATPCKTDDTDTCEYGELVDERDGQTYKTVKIGDQVWMAENLNHETANSYCYNDSTEYCTKYGRFYTWDAATTACPSGWRLPTFEEIETLLAAVGGVWMTGEMLKSTSGWYDNGNGTDDYSFAALSTGYRLESGEYSVEGYYAYFWSSTERYSDTAYYLFLYYGKDDGSIGSSSKDLGLSVRCLKD